MPREARNSGIRWGRWLAAAVWCLILVSGAMAAHKVRHFMATEPQFTFSGPRALAIEGLRYASRQRVLQVFAPDYGRSIFLMPLAERRRRLLAVDWVEDASISRTWPNRVVARLRERRPVAFVNLPWSRTSRESRVALIDAYGVLLDPPLQTRFTFPVLSGVTEQQSEPARRARVEVMQRLLEDLGPLGKDISEVNVEATDNVKIIAQVGGRTLELMLGDGNYLQRFQNFLNHYPEIRKRSGHVSAFDLRLDDRITAKE